jgi:hypothetical protein
MLVLLSQFYTIFTDYKPLNGERTSLYSAISRCQYPIGAGILPVKQSVKNERSYSCTLILIYFLFSSLNILMRFQHPELRMECWMVG